MPSNMELGEETKGLGDEGYLHRGRRQWGSIRYAQAIRETQEARELGKSDPGPVNQDKSVSNMEHV